MVTRPVRIVFQGSRYRDFVGRTIRIIDSGNYHIDLKSRVFLRNLVYSARDEAGHYCYGVKLFCDSHLSKERFLMELHLGNNLVNGCCGFKVPRIIYYKLHPIPGVTGVIVQQWIAGTSLMEKVRRNIQKALQVDIPAVFESMKVLWAQDYTKAPLTKVKEYSDLKNDRPGVIGARFGFGADVAFERFAARYPQEKKNISKLYTHYNSHMPRPTGEAKFINGDPSAHEMIWSGGTIWWLDWENASIDDSAIDVAGLYHSVGHVYCDDTTIDSQMLELFLTYFKFKGLHCFGRYFTDRLLCAALFTQGGLPPNEVAWAVRRAIMLLNN